MAPEFGKPIHHLQLIQADILKKHCVHEPLDKRFPVRRLPASSALARRPGSADRQLWQLCKRRKLGCRISEAAATGDGNFLMPEIAHTARREAAYREIGALIRCNLSRRSELNSTAGLVRYAASCGRQGPG